MANLKIKRCFRIETRVGKGVVELMFPSEGLNRSEGFPASLKGHPPGHLDVCCSSTRMSCGFSMDVDVVAQAALHTKNLKFHWHVDERKSAETPAVVEHSIANALHLIL